MSGKIEITSTEELYQAFSELHAEGGWHRKFPALWPEPVKNFEPTLWRYRDIKPVLEAAGRLVSAEHAERRNLTLCNPLEGNRYATVRTLVAAYQMIKPGETAKSHRHTPNALRLILEGKGTYTVVDGQRIEMRPGDVLLTPSWAWHSHESVGQQDCYWMDFLDVPLVHLLEPMFFERHPDGLEDQVVDVQQSPAAFRWEDTCSALERAEHQVSPEADRMVELGSPALDSIALSMQKLFQGSSSSMLQTTANSIFAVVRGEGETVIDGKSHCWSFGDTIAVPGWRSYQHHAKSDAVLLRVTDSALMEKFGWLRTRVL
jgi:gentisate 1,2-dioxygenase